MSCASVPRCDVPHVECRYSSRNDELMTSFRAAEKEVSLLSLYCKVVRSIAKTMSPRCKPLLLQCKAGAALLQICDSQLQQKSTTRPNWYTPATNFEQAG